MSIVYVLSNPAMPGLVKIGRTDNEDASVRIGQLYTTGVPVPFDLEFACRVDNPDAVENALHTAFAPNRINANREFFKIEPEQAVAILKLLQIRDATKEVNAQPSDIDRESIAAGAELKRKGPKFNFSEMGIPLGATLQFTRGEAEATVVGAKKVRFLDEEMSLTSATRQALKLDYNVAPGLYWTINGRLLRDIYEETYS
jgi:hypothetical protein